MENIKNKKAKKITAVVISVMISLVLSGIATVIAGLNYNHESSVINVIATLFTGLAVACFSMSVASIVVSLICEDKFILVAALFLMFFTFIFTLIVFAFFIDKIWILIILGIISLPFPVLGVILVYRKNMVLVTDDEKPDYKNYKTRKQEKLIAQSEGNGGEEEVLPEIKSFK